MRKLFLQSVLCFVFIIGSHAIGAKERPQIEFNGAPFYLAEYVYETDANFVPVNIVETYLPVGETFETYSKLIKRVTLLQVTNFKATANSMLTELKQDNSLIPYTLQDSSKGKMVLNLTFWWSFRPNVIMKNIYVFDEDKVARRAMYYHYQELDYPETSTTNDMLKAQGKNLLLDSKIVQAVEALEF